MSQSAAAAIRRRAAVWWGIFFIEASLSISVFLSSFLVGGGGVWATASPTLAKTNATPTDPHGHLAVVVLCDHLLI